MPQLALTSNFGGGAARTIRTSRAEIARRKRVVNVKSARKVQTPLYAATTGER
ncbi:MAG: hypothetical protein ACOVT5_14745 [Armatimonadaceae bacterium]